jgi:hypothetical protein
MGVRYMQENKQQALDVIQQGLAMQDNADAGYDATRCDRLWLPIPLLCSD